MGMLTINDVEVVSPVEGSWDDGTLSTDQSGRDNSGYMHNEIITTKKTLPYTWGTLTALETKTLLQAIKKNGFGNVNVTVHNPEENAFTTYNCYVDDRHVPIGYILNNEIYYNGISVTFIEN